MINFRDPDGKLYVYCTWVSIVFIIVPSVVSMTYLVAMAPSEAYVLTSGKEQIGVWLPLISGIVFLVCLIILILDIRKRLKDCPSEDRDKCLMRAPLSKAGILFCITAFLSIVVMLFSDFIGESISTSMMDGLTNYEIMVQLMIAGPEEEFLCRGLMIGVPIAVISFIKGYKGSIKYIFGGFGMSKAALILLVISSIAFGLLHLDGWSIMKFPDTFISGVLFGYVYIQYGIHSTIVMHSAFDLMAGFDFFCEGLGTVPMTIACILGAILLVRSIIRFREYIPKNNLHEPLDGNLLQMWSRS